MRRGTWIFAVILVGALCLSGYVAYIVIERAMDKACSWSEMDLQGVAKRTGLEFPENAKLLGALWFHCWLTSDVWAAVRVDKDGFEAMLDALSCSPVDHDLSCDFDKEDFADWVPQLTSSIALSSRGLEAEPTWWQPDSANNFVICGWSQPYFNRLLADLDDETEAVLYIYSRF